MRTRWARANKSNDKPPAKAAIAKRLLVFPCLGAGCALLPLRLPAVLIIALAALLASAAQAADSDSGQKTGKLIAVLQSDASLFEKARACQQLGEIGTRDAVPALAALLASPELGAYARSGLEGIPDPSAVAALREAAGQLKGPPLMGVLNSLGVLRDGQAVELLRKLAADPGSGVVKEALLALGKHLIAPIHLHPRTDTGQRT